MELEPKLVGRDSEIEAIIGYFGDALKGNGSLVLMSGEAGIGKTRVLNTVASMARSSGFKVMIGNCIPGVSNPYLPFHDAFAPFLDGPFIDSPETVYPTIDSSKRMFRVLDFLEEKGPVLLCLEDLHWADSMSVQLIHFLARNANGLRLAILGTYRPEDIFPKHGESRSAFMETLHTMKREGVVREIQLERIGEAQLTAAIQSMLGGSMTKALAHRIAAESGGNPLFAVETVKMLVISGGVALKNGTWELTTTGPLIIPSTVQEVILSRLEKLPLEQRRILECASVIGDYFDPSIISKAMNLGRTDVLEALDSLETTYRLVRSMDVVYAFEHDKIREVTYDRISAPRRKDMHGTVGAVLEARLPNDRLLGILSHHFHMAGDRTKSADYSLKAGEFSFNNSGGPEAVVFFQRALDGIRKGEANGSLKIKALLGLGDCYYDIADYASAERAFNQGLNITNEQSQRGHFLWRLALCNAPNLLGKGQTSQAWKYIEMAEGLEGLDDFDLAMTFNQKALIETFEDKLADANISYQKTEEVLVRINRTERLADIYDFHASLLIALGKTEEAFHMEVISQEAFNAMKSPYSTMIGEMSRAQFCIAQGREEEAWSHINTVELLATKLCHEVDLHFALAQKSMIYEMQMDYEMARSQSLKAIEVAEKFKEGLVYARACSVLSRIDIMTGRDDEAFALLNQAEMLAKPFDWKIKTPARGMILIAKAMSSGLLGETTKCFDLGKEAINILEGGATNPGECPICRQTFGVFLLGLGYKEKGLMQLEAAREIFLSYGNVRQVERIDKLSL
jgi:tetratricopeptide (TPR) repeat protein